MLDDLARIGDPHKILKAFEAEKARRLAETQLAHYRPYKKQLEFHAAGLTYRFRTLMAANQVGKTLSAGSEVAMHLTGEYPSWWSGMRFNRPTRWIGGSESAELTRKGIQRIMVGEPEVEAKWGTGTVPKKRLKSWARRQGVPDALASFSVTHVSGGVSVMQLASYDQGRARWQADTVDGVWFDEEPPADIYSEGVTRTNTTLGPVLMTLTPIFGMSDVCRRLLIENPENSVVINMTLDDAEHYTPDQRLQIIASYPEHERDARTKGIPHIGSGLIYPIAQDRITYQPFPFPKFWKRIIGIDFGWDHPTAGAWLTYDPDGDVIYLSDVYRQRLQTPPIHAAAFKMKGGDKISIAWPHDGLNHKDGGEPLAEQYRKFGLKMLPEPATFADEKGRSVDAGCMEILTRMQTGRFKVAPHLAEFWEEFRLYHRKPTGPLNIPQIVKINDDVLDAVRYAVMMLRFAIADDSHPHDRYRQAYKGSGSSAWAA